MRQKVGCIITLPLAQVETMPADLDEEMFTRMDKAVDKHIEAAGGRRLGKILHLREQYPNPRASAPAKTPNLGVMVDWRAWAFAEFPDEPA